MSCAGYTVDTRSSSSSSSSPYVLTRESVERDVFWDYYQQSQGDTGKLQCFCQGALQQHGLKVGQFALIHEGLTSRSPGVLQCDLLDRLVLAVIALTFGSALRPA